MLLIVGCLDTSTTHEDPQDRVHTMAISEPTRSPMKGVTPNPATDEGLGPREHSLHGPLSK